MEKWRLMGISLCTNFSQVTWRGSGSNLFPGLHELGYWQSYVVLCYLLEVFISQESGLLPLSLEWPQILELGLTQKLHKKSGPN